jgi:Transmembrane secretion effector
LFASSVWALLPLTAHSQLHLGSGGYGLLLGCVGVGALAGAAVLPRLRTRLTPGAQLTAGSAGLAGLALSPLAGLRYRFQVIPPAGPAARRGLAGAEPGRWRPGRRAGHGDRRIPGAARARG